MKIVLKEICTLRATGVPYPYFVRVPQDQAILDRAHYGPDSGWPCAVPLSWHSSSIRAYKNIVPHLLDAAKVLILVFWKKQVPTIEHWAKQVNGFMENEKWVTWVSSGTLKYCIQHFFFFCSFCFAVLIVNIYKIKIIKKRLFLSAECFRGCDQTADFLHCFWTCPVIQGFWIDIGSSSALGLPNFMNPKHCLLGIFCDLPIPSHAKKLLRILYFYVKKSILLSWKGSQSLARPLWLKLINDSLPLYKLTF